MASQRKSEIYASGASMLVICVVGGILWFFLAGGSTGLTQFSTYLILGLFALSVDFMWGYGGMLSFGQAAFFGLGCYGYGIITTGRIMDIPPEASLIGLAVGGTVPALLALCVGYFMFYGNVTGPYFTIVTLALAFLIRSLALAWPSLFGGWTGIPDVAPLTLDFIGVTIQKGLSGFILITIINIAVALFLRWILVSPFGLKIHGLRDNEERIQYLGTSLAGIKLIIFVISAAIAGVAGALYAAQTGYVSPDLLGVVVSTEVVVFVAVGGKRTLLGAVIGAIIVRGVGYWLGGAAVDYWQLLMGIMFVVVVLFFQDGLMGGLYHLARFVLPRSLMRSSGAGGPGGVSEN